MTEQELVQRARKGDELAFEQLVSDNEKRIYNLCCRLTGNPDDGAELAQEAFAAGWQGVVLYSSDSLTAPAAQAEVANAAALLGK